MANSIGGLWSFTTEIKPLIDFLSTKAKDSELNLLDLTCRQGLEQLLMYKQKLPQLLLIISQKKLKSFGEMPANLTSYEQPKTLNWHQVDDGVLVLKQDSVSFSIAERY